VLPQVRDLALQDVPYEVVVNAEVLVNEPIPHAGHRALFNRRMLGANRRSDFYRGLTDDLETANKRALRGLVRVVLSRVTPVLALVR
jgi:hypothetical protein